MKTYISKRKQEWSELIGSTSPEIRTLAAEIAREHAISISQAFYEIVLDDPETEVFLTNEQVEKHLKQALARWTENVLTCTPESIDQMIAIQQHVGEMHARIGIPVQLVEMGARTLKKILFHLIQSPVYDRTDQSALCRFVVVSIDLAMEIMSRVFSFRENSASREDENYRIFSLLENAEEERERQCVSLLSWENDVIYKVMVDADMESIRPLSQADFGLWFNHKGRHYFSGLPETGYIAKQIQKLDQLVISTQNTPKALARREQRVSLLLQVKNALLQITTFLKTLFDEMSRHEVGMDVLTRLLNRRFLPTIFKREIAHANRNGTPLSVLIIDVDKFKQINDSYGHQTGDEILCKVSQVFYNNVRSSDYVFRYGGDEFLIVMTEVSEHVTRQVAERIRMMVSKQTIIAPDGQHIGLSLSIGGAIFSGHPDYERLIQAADKALYRAKALGRNRVEM